MEWEKRNRRNGWWGVVVVEGIREKEVKKRKESKKRMRVRRGG